MHTRHQRRWATTKRTIALASLVLALASAVIASGAAAQQSSFGEYLPTPDGATWHLIATQSAQLGDAMWEPSATRPVSLGSSGHQAAETPNWTIASVSVLLAGMTLAAATAHPHRQARHKEVNYLCRKSEMLITPSKPMFVPKTLAGTH